MRPIGLKKGQVVMVYEDPITRMKPEGRATLVNFEMRDNDGYYNLERWEVRFKGDTVLFSRKILSEG